MNIHGLVYEFIDVPVAIMGARENILGFETALFNVSNHLHGFVMFNPRIY